MKHPYLLKLIAVVVIFCAGFVSATGVYVLKRSFNIPFFTKSAPVQRIQTTGVIGLDWTALKERFTFLKKVTLTDTMLYFPDGEQHIDETVIIPAGYTITLRPNSHFLLAPGVSLVSYSPIIADGTNGAISFDSADPVKPFGVIAVLDTERPSELRNVEIRHGSDAYLDGQYVSGATSFIRSEVRIYKSIFSESRAEDGLNIRYATTTIEDTRFLDNAHDGLDLDSSHGIVRNNAFERSGDQGIDLGSSTIVFSNNRFAKGNMCMEIGEGSRVTWENNIFTDCLFRFRIDPASHLSIVGSEL